MDIRYLLELNFEELNKYKLGKPDLLKEIVFLIAKIFGYVDINRSNYDIFAVSPGSSRHNGWPYIVCQFQACSVNITIESAFMSRKLFLAAYGDRDWTDGERRDIQKFVYDTYSEDRPEGCQFRRYHGVIQG